VLGREARNHTLSCPGVGGEKGKAREEGETSKAKSKKKEKKKKRASKSG
jgi:hypothetical protein